MLPNVWHKPNMCNNESVDGLQGNDPAFKDSGTKGA